MISVIEKYLDQEFLEFLSSLFSAAPAGVLLAVIAWLISYLVYAAFSLFKKC